MKQSEKWYKQTDSYKLSTQVGHLKVQKNRLETKITIEINFIKTKIGDFRNDKNNTGKPEL